MRALSKLPNLVPGLGLLWLYSNLHTKQRPLGSSPHLSSMPKASTASERVDRAAHDAPCVADASGPLKLLHHRQGR